MYQSRVRDSFDEFCEHVLCVQSHLTATTVPSDVAHDLKLHITEKFMQDKDVAYCACAFADETMLMHQWHGAHTWFDLLLEQSFFNSNRAGDDLFNRIDALLQDATNADLAYVYSRVLALGFCGRYRGSEGNEIRMYIEQLQKYLMRTDPVYAAARQHPYEEYYRVRMSGHRAKCQDRCRYIKWLALFWCLFLIVSTLIWYRQTSSAREIMKATELLLLSHHGMVDNCNRENVAQNSHSRSVARGIEVI